MASKAVDITIADRMASQMKIELQINELRKRVLELEQELLKNKTEVRVESNPTTLRHTITVELNQKVKTVSFGVEELDYYLSGTNSLQDFISDALDHLTVPYREIIACQISPVLSNIFMQRQIEKRGSAL